MGPSNRHLDEYGRMATPQQIGRYLVRERIGSGGFATVWRAFDPELEGDVAVKILAENWIERSDIRSRFVEEARMLRRADSDRVVRVYDIGTLDDDRPYFVMSHADGGTLADRLAGGPLPVDAALGYIADAARGIAVLHDLGVLHRDIKPSNILFHSTAAGERMMIADLGLAKAIAHASGFTVAAGTPGYMAPEQARMGGGLDKRVDVYALGALAYQMLTGARPNSATGERIAPPAELRRDVPHDVGALVMRALESDRERRWPDASSLAGAAEGIRARLRAAEAPTPDAAAPAPPASVPPVHRPHDVPAAVSGETPTPQRPRLSAGPPGPPSFHQTAPPQEHPSFPGQRWTPGAEPPTRYPTAAGAKEPRTPEQRATRRRRLTVVGCACLALLLLGIGSLVWIQVRPERVRTTNAEIVVDVPQSWVRPTIDPGESTEDLSRFGEPRQQGLVLTTQTDSAALDSDNGITVLAGKAFADLDKSALDPPNSVSRDSWDPTRCDAKHADTSVSPAGFSRGTLRTWQGADCSHWYGQAILSGDGFGVQVFMVSEADQDEFADVLDTLEVKGTALP
ncbi:MAG: protein kinase [Streptosporangiales bacterium]|nr:protein kinase [Streptosporangiales bacterium]